MSYSTPWPRVYPGVSKLPQKELKRLTIEFPMTEADLIMSVAINPAVFSLICQTALHSTAREIEKHAYTYADAPTLIKFICQRTNSGVVETPAALPVTGGTPRVHPGAAQFGYVTPGAGEEVAHGSGGEGNKEGKRGKDRQSKSGKVVR